MRVLVIFFLFGLGMAAHAEWFMVKKVLDYNQVEAEYATGEESKNTIRIRIKNLEKIEYIENDRQKTLLGGGSPKDLLREMVWGQIVWIEGLENVNGEYVGHIYPSYEQVVKVFMKQRMTGSYNVSPNIKSSLQSVAQKMFSNLRNGNPTDGKTPKGEFYQNDYSKALFVYDGLEWFKEDGQYLPAVAQKLYVDWLSSYMSASGTDAREYETKISDMQGRYKLYRDFIFDE